MTNQALKVQTIKISCRQQLFLVPRRTCTRELWVPGGRTLHLIDIENLMGGPRQGREALEAACRSYVGLVQVGPNDHIVIACNDAIAVHAGLALPGCRLLVGHGPDGADLALLDQLRDLVWAASRYDRVIIGSGDGIFADAVSGLRRLGIPVGVTSRQEALAYVLATAASFVVYLPDVSTAGAAA